MYGDINSFSKALVNRVGQPNYGPIDLIIPVFIVMMYEMLNVKLIGLCTIRWCNQCYFTSLLQKM